MRFRSVVLLPVLAGTMTACSLSDLLEGNDPSTGTVVDPNTLKSFEGGLAQYYAAIYSMSLAVAGASEEVGVFTDELSGGIGGSIYLDGRTVGENGTVTEGAGSQSYVDLQKTRVRAAQASTLLSRYGTTASAPLIGHAYALQGQSILMMAEMLCSGIPLPDVPFEGGVAYTAPLSTKDLLERAVALFDTAYQYGKDSLPIATFAQVGKGRALLSLGRYADAAQAVSGVPTDAKYTITYTLDSRGVQFRDFAQSTYVVLNREGNNGITWIADSAQLQDPRLPLSTRPDGSFTDPIKQQKFITRAPTVVIADGIQARLIEAEAQLQPASAPQGPWLATLNAARATRGLTPLSDPGTANARIDTLFRERALWLYLTGTRLGDMRRLVRNYGRRPEQVYAQGPYPFGGGLVVRVYGSELVFVPAADEQQYNPLYKGCQSKEP